MIRFHTLTLLILTSVLSFITSATPPKREFRGAWLHIIGQKQFAHMTPEQTQQYLVRQLDSLQLVRTNAVIWQIRPQADAAYQSALEPWSRWITGTAGQAPEPKWDPLQFMIEQCHQRGMELHAWINPYRVTSSKEEQLPTGHIYFRHPEWFVKYADGKIYFDPGLPQCRDYINLVVKDIVQRYDIDAIHMDDYFYPYPVPGHDFPDSVSYAKYGRGWNNIGDWRRNNVDLLIEQLHHTIKSTKPWVRLGISPFGIWRNKASDPRGSNTAGLQCYDALYADCPHWTAQGWVDYMVPQLYWALGHSKADVLELMHWWDRNANNRHMYYGYAVRNVMTSRDIAREHGDTLNPTQLDHKMRLQRSLPHVQGHVWWPGYDVTSNFHGVADSLITSHQASHALVPAYTWIDSIAPDTVHGLVINRIEDRWNQNSISTQKLTWQPIKTSDPLQEARFYVVYLFPASEAIDLNNSTRIIGITSNSYYLLPHIKAGEWKFVVTAVDRCGNEGPASAPLHILYEYCM